MSGRSGILIIGMLFFIINSQAGLAEDVKAAGSEVVGTVKDEVPSWYAIVKVNKRGKQLYTRGDIFCSDTDITKCLRIEDIKKDTLVLVDVASKKVFTVRPGERLPLEGSGIIFEKTVAADVIEYRYNKVSGARKKELVEDFTVKGLEDNKKVIVEKDYDKTYLPGGLSEEEKELFGSPKMSDDGSEKIKAGLFDRIEVKKTGKDTWTVNTEKADMALSNVGKTLFSVIKKVEPRYRFGAGPSLKLNSELGDVVINKEGFLVQDLAVGKIVERAGIRKGDLIRSINGQPVNSLYGVYRAYMSVKSDRSVKIVKIDIVRERQRRVLTYKVR